MNHIGQKISAARKEKGFSQEELAELSKMNLRTIQRIENNQSEPRGKTLQLICDALELDVSELQIPIDSTPKKSITAMIINTLFLILINILLVALLNYLLIDLEANTNSRLGALLLSFLIPFFIVYHTSKMNPAQRLLKFGTGYIMDIILVFAIQGLLHGFQLGMRTGLFLCLVISIGTLFYGNAFLKKET